MSRAMDCGSCLSGDHDKHVRDWNITPGLLGGEWCPCTGDCAERAAKAFEKWADLFDTTTLHPGSRVVTPEPVASRTDGDSPTVRSVEEHAATDDRARVMLTEDERERLYSPIGNDSAYPELPGVVADLIAERLAQRAACGAGSDSTTVRGPEERSTTADPTIEAIRALADELRAHAAAELPDDDRWDDGWRAAHRKIDARLRAALEDPRPSEGLTQRSEG